MNCEEVRLHLAAYRRSDWSGEEQKNISKHLLTCAACRKWESEARVAGEKIRQLPTIEPPADFRSRVFAAIRAEQLQDSLRNDQHAVPSAKPAAVKLSSATRIGEISATAARPRTIIFGKFTAIASAAAILVIMFLTRFSALSSTSLAVPNDSFCITSIHCATAPLRVSAPADFPTITSALADRQYVVFTAENSANQSMLFARNRDSAKTYPLLTTAVNTTIAVQSLNGNMLTWYSAASNGTWSLNESPITIDDGIQEFADTNYATVVFSGQTIGGQTVAKLLSYWGSATSSVGVLQFTNSQTELITIQESADLQTVNYTTVTVAEPPYTIVDPYVDSTNIYWVEKSIGPDGSPNGTIWTSQSGSPAIQITNTNTSFGPDASGANIAWFEAAGTRGATSGINASNASLAGTIDMAQLNASTLGQQQPQIKASPLLNGNAIASSVFRGQGYLLWQNNKGSIFIYIVGNSQPEQFDHMAIPLNSDPALTSNSATWISQNTNGASTIYVLDIN